MMVGAIPCGCPIIYYSFPLISGIFIAQPKKAQRQKGQRQKGQPQGIAPTDFKMAANERLSHV
jgi:hypothetical protein